MGLRAPKSPRKLPQVLDADEMTRLVEVPTDAPLGVRDRAMLELFYSSGLRLSRTVRPALARRSISPTAW